MSNDANDHKYLKSSGIAGSLKARISTVYMLKV